MKATAAMPIKAMAALLAIGLGTAAGWAQANFVENFDDVSPNGTAYGPYELIDRGWDFRMQSSPPNYMGVAAPYGGWPWGGSQAGTAHLIADYYAEGLGGGGRANHWAILPPVPNQAAGDPLTVWMRAADNAYPARLEIRYSPGGGLSTGSGPDGVGDFTQVLLDLNPVPAGAWQQYTTTVPGAGRLAFRFTVDYPVTALRPKVEIDSLSVGNLCPAPPLPTAGQAVTWTLAGSPYRICRTLTIPAGGTVVVEPGVRVNFDAAGILYVAGTLQAAGTAQSNVTLTGQLDSRIYIQGGTVDWGRCRVRVTIVPLPGGTLACDDCTFSGQGFIDSWPDALFYAPPFVFLKNCTFTLCSADIQYATVDIRNVTFNSPVEPPRIWDGFQRIDGLHVDQTAGSSGGLVLYSPYRGDPVYITGLSITNTAGPALRHAGGNYELGPGTVLQNSLVPVHGDWGAGLMPGTVIPATGNVNNYVQIGDHDSYVTLHHDPIWAPVGVPYVARGSVFFNSSFTILPGVTVKMGLGAALVPDQGPLFARGLPTAPIVFERADPGIPWGGFLMDGRLENCIIDGSDYGTLSGCYGESLRIDNCTYVNNGSCVRCGTTVRKTQFLGNTSVSQPSTGGGDFNGLTNPNEFVGNAATIHDVADARYNWWGDASGPYPTGGGDPVGPGVPFDPWLSAEPDFADAPPVVHVLQPSILLETGRKIIITWEATDELPIASYDVIWRNVTTGLITIASNLPGSQHSVEWTIPDVAYDPSNSNTSITVYAHDAAGQIGWDAWVGITPDESCLTSLPSLPFTFGGQTFRANDYFPPLGWSPSVMEEFFLLDDNTQTWTFLGAVPEIARFPAISTDRARLVLKLRGNLNCMAFYFDQPFAIRPDTRVGDAPPVVEMLTPAAGATFPSGGIVPISWTASDDEQVRSFNIQASYDAGRTWDLIAKDLPPAATSFNWQLPASGGIPDVRVRVIACDRRFQTSSDGAVRAFAILPGGVWQAGDTNCDGTINQFDIQAFITALADPAGYGSHYPNCDIRSADVNGDGTVNPFDIQAFIDLLTP